MSRPEISSAWSRMISAGRRKRGPRASRRFSGSRATSSGEARRILAIGGREDHPLHQRLDVPARVDELARQPVEQFGMTGPLALHAEVVAGLDQALTEQLLPEAIDHHARGQRMVGLGEPLRQPQAVLRRALGPGAEQLLGHPGFDLLTGRVVARRE